MIEAEGRHRRAALLSNSLHRVPDDDVESAMRIIQQIGIERDAWRELRKKVKFFDETGQWPEVAVKPEVSEGVAKLQLELMRLRTNIWKKGKNISDNPESSKKIKWEEELAALMLQKQKLEEQIIKLKYA